MPRFDPVSWKERAFERYRRAPSTCSRAASRLAQDLAATVALDRLVSWCGQQGVEVSFDQHGGGRYKEGKVDINSSLTPERQLHVLLHECGHHVIGRRAHEKRFSRGYSEADPARRRSTAHRIDVLHEELEAWHEGSLLAEQIGVHVDKDRYNRTRTGYVRSYLKWVLRVPGYEGGLNDEQAAEAARR